MATRSKTTTTRESDGIGRKLTDQPRRFAGLGLVPFAGLLISWFIHLYVQGTHIAWGPVDYTFPGSLAALVVTSSLLTLAAVGFGITGWQFAKHREDPFRYGLAGTSFAIGAMFAVSVGVGPHYWWSFAFILTGEAAAVMWAQTRLNVTRRDPREKEERNDEDDLLREWGLTGYKPKITEVVADEDGPIRTEIAVTHKKGGTIQPLQGALANLESAAGAPAGLSRIVATDKANKSVLTILHRDPLAGRLPYGPLSSPGGSITDPIIVSVYDDGHPCRVPLAGGQGFSATNRGYVGMTRSGKTVGENLGYVDIISRRDVVILYLNKSKGVQDARPILPGIEVAVVSNQQQDYITALSKVEGIMDYRQRELGAYGISEWSAKRCYDNPPQRKANGNLEPMAPMPQLVVHIGEADSVIEPGTAAGDRADRIASKCLSLGIVLAFSLQRASAEKLGSNLRANIGLWFCFGTNDDYSGSFVLGDSVIKAGADPQRFGQRMPGNHYVVGPGIDEANFAKRVKTFAGKDTGDDQRDNATLQEEMLSRTREWGPRMARLDRGSARATGIVSGELTWWDQMAAATDVLRDDLLGPAGGTANMTATDNPQTPQPTPQSRSATPQPHPAATPQPATRNPQPTPQFLADPAPQGETAEDVETAAEIAAEVREVREVDGIELYPTDESGESALSMDLTLSMTPPPADGDEVTFADELPEAPSREIAVADVHRVLRELMADPAFRDPSDNDTAIIQVSDIHGRLRYKSRTWFSTTLADMASGKVTPPPSLSLARAEDLGGIRAGKYRLRRVPDPDAV